MILSPPDEKLELGLLEIPSPAEQGPIETDGRLERSRKVTRSRVKAHISSAADGPSGIPPGMTISP